MKKQALGWRLGVIISCLMGVTCTAGEHEAPLLPAVEAEMNIYNIGDPDNGAGPMWCHGSTLIARRSNDVFASGIEILPDQKPLNNVRWTLFKQTDHGFKLMQADPKGRQREPCPLGIFSDGRLLLTSNPTQAELGARDGLAQPQLLVFDANKLTEPPKIMLPVWEGTPAFTEHSYRGFCVDGSRGEALYLQNVGYDSSFWSFLDHDGRWSRFGKITMPWGAEFEKPEPVRICYQSMALRNRAAHIMGVSDIIEPIREWREYKLILNNGRRWDYDFRRLYYCYTPDIAKEPWSSWILVADCDKTCGHISSLDLWLDKQGRAHILWLEQSVWDRRVRDKFFPATPQTYALMYGIINQGKVIQKTRLVFGGEKQDSGEIPGYARFQATPDGRLFVFYYIHGADAQKRTISENRLLELYPDGTFSKPVRVALEHPFNNFMTATERGGSVPSSTLDILGTAQDVPGLSYARINLLSKVLAQFDCTVTRTPVGSELSLDAKDSRAAGGKVASYEWQIGDARCSGQTATQTMLHSGWVKVSLTVKDAAGNSNRMDRTIPLPPVARDFGLTQWGLVERIEAESFAAESGGVVRVSERKLNASGMSLSDYNTKGHWLEWAFRVPAADRYFLFLRYVGPTGSVCVLTVDGVSYGELVFPGTGGYGSDSADNWDFACLRGVNGKPVPLELGVGEHKLRLETQNELGVNLDYLELVAANASFPAEAETPGFKIKKEGYRYLLPLQGALAPTQIRAEIGFCYNYTLGPLFPGDGANVVPPSTLRLFEDGKALGPAQAVHVDIRNQGKGRYSHWGRLLYFAASDNSDPQTNGRKYTWQIDGN